jgi:hypothetical protein
MASAESHNSLPSLSDPGDPCLSGLLELLLSILTTRSSRAVLYCSAFHRMHYLLPRGLGVPGILQALHGGLNGKCGSRDGSFEP